MGMPLTIEEVQGCFGPADTEPTELEQARMAGTVDVPGGLFTDEQFADILDIMTKHGP